MLERDPVGEAKVRTASLLHSTWAMDGVIASDRRGREGDTSSISMSDIPCCSWGAQQCTIQSDIHGMARARGSIPSGRSHTCIDRRPLGVIWLVWVCGRTGEPAGDPKEMGQRGSEGTSTVRNPPPDDDLVPSLSPFPPTAQWLREGKGSVGGVRPTSTSLLKDR